jgi:hypothetical protein
MQVAHDIIQLQGLCQRIDKDAFLPIRDEELTGKYHGRIFDFAKLPEDALIELEHRGLAERGGLKQGRGLGFRGSYFLLRGAAVFYPSI